MGASVRRCSSEARSLISCAPSLDGWNTQLTTRTRTWTSSSTTASPPSQWRPPTTSSPKGTPSCGPSSLLPLLLSNPVAPQKTDAILECTPNCPATRVLFDPEVKGWDAVGHVNAFTALHHPAALNGEGIWSFMDRYVLEGKASLVDGEVRDFRGGAVKSEEKL